MFKNLNQMAQILYIWSRAYWLYAVFLNKECLKLKLTSHSFTTTDLLTSNK